MTPKELVQQIYAAFGRGDIAHILSTLSPDVVWEDPGAPGIPYAGSYRGPDSVGDFFRKLGHSTEFLRFEPKEYIEQGNRVVAFGDYEARSKATGRSISSNWAMSWTVQGGKVTRFEAFLDTAKVAAIYKSAAHAS